jgi:hypothetical protein
MRPRSPLRYTKQVGISGHLYFRTYRTSCRCHSAPAWNCRTRCTSRFSSNSPGEPGLVQVTLRASRSAKTGARAPRFSARSRRRRGRGGRSGRRRVIAVKLPSQRFKSNEMPVAPDRVCPIRSSPFFWTVRRSNRSGFAPLGAGRNRAGTPGRCRRSKRARPAPPRPPRPERRRTADPDWRRRGRARGHAGRRGPASIRMHPLLRRDLWVAVSLIRCTGGA